MSESLLPPNATPLERAMESILNERIGAVPVPLRDLWNSESCPSALLPYLAWACSVDVWDNDWEDATKRRVIASSFIVHRQKGTVGAVKTALDALGFEATITEWWEEAAQPHTFRIDCTVQDVLDVNLPLTRKLADIIGLQINQVKPAREHYTLRVGEVFTAPQPVRSAFTAILVDRATHVFELSEAI